MSIKETGQIDFKNISIDNWNLNKIDTPLLSLYHGFSPLNTGQNNPKFDTIKPALSTILDHRIANPTEQEKVTHHDCRDITSPLNKSIKDFIHSVVSNQETIEGRPITHVCQIGIGGSISGPKAIIHALKAWGYNETIKSHFISNHDEQHIINVLNELQFNSTLFIIASKSGTTVEVIKAINVILNETNTTEEEFYKNHCIAITTKKSPLVTKSFKKQFIFESSVGGRFSTTSPIGTLILGLSFGPTSVDSFLTGAAEMDAIELSNRSLTNNIAFHLACLNVAYRNDMGWEQLGLVPYGEGLAELPDFLMQLISESLGKKTTLNGIESSTNNCPNIIHGVGPNAQHSFFQQLHQSKSITPVEFIMAKPTTKNQHHILQQICGQMVGLAKGGPSTNRHHHFSGNRPSILIYLKEQSSKALGSLIATYENRVMYESLILNINGFDQPGVELSKKITRLISKNGSDLASQIISSIVDK